MNIFILDKDPVISASYHCDKHVVKMLVESAQMFGSTHWFMNGFTSKKQILNIETDIWQNFPRSKPYGIGFMNHPCTKWLRSSSENYNWQMMHANALYEEYRKRYGREMNISRILKWFSEASKQYIFPQNSMTPFALAMNVEFKVDDAVESYRNYYRAKKRNFAKWKYTDEPSWFMKKTET